MAMNQFGIGMVFRGTDGVSPVARRIGSSLFGLRQKAEMSMAGMNRAMAGAVVGFQAMQAGFGMAGMAKGMADMAGQFEEKMASIGVISGATAEQMDQLHDSALDAALATQFSPDEAAEGLQTMAAMGLTAKESTEALVPVLDLAAGAMGQLGLADAADAVVGTMKAFGMEASNATTVTDKLLKITTLTNFQARDFGTGLARAASTAKLFGQSLDDALIQMGLLRNLNIEASVASTSLRESWRRLAADAKAQQVVMSQGVEIFDKETGKTRQLMDVMTDLAEKTEDLTDKERNRIAVQAFGVRGMAAFNAVVDAQAKAMINGVEVTIKGADAVNYLRKQMQDASGAAAEMREKLLDTYEGQKKLIKGSREALGIVVGEAATKLFKPLARMIFHVISGIANFMREIPMEARQALLGIVTAFGTLIGTAGAVIAFSAAMNFLGLSIGGVIVTLGKFMLFMGPAMLLVGGMAATIAAVAKALKSNVGGIGDWFASWAKKIKLIWSGVTDIISGKGYVSEKTFKRMQKSGNEGLLPVIRNIAGWVKRLQVFWDGLKEGWLQAIDALQPKLELLRRTFGGILDRFLYDGDRPAETMEKWYTAGQRAGKSIGRLGEIMIDWLNESAPKIESMLNSLRSLSADDIRGGIVGVVETFRSMLKVIRQLVGFVRVLANFFDWIGSSIGENIGGFSRYAQMMTGQMSMKEYYAGRARAAEDGGETGRAWRELTSAWEQMTTGRDTESRRIREQNDRLASMLKRHRAIQEWVDTPAAQWTQTARSFEEANPAMREQYVGEMNRLADAINKLAKRPMVAKVTIDEIGKSSIAHAQAEADRELFEGGMSVPSY